MPELVMLPAQLRFAETAYHGIDAINGFPTCTTEHDKITSTLLAELEGRQPLLPFELAVIGSASCDKIGGNIGLQGCSCHYL